VHDTGQIAHITERMCERLHREVRLHWRCGDSAPIRGEETSSRVKLSPMVVKVATLHALKA
jgi:hypothetical protein